MTHKMRLALTTYHVYHIQHSINLPAIRCVIMYTVLTHHLQCISYTLYYPTTYDVYLMHSIAWGIAYTRLRPKCLYHVSLSCVYIINIHVFAQSVSGVKQYAQCYLCMYVSIYLCIYVSMYLCIYDVCMHVCMYACVYVCMYAHA